MRLNAAVAYVLTDEQRFAVAAAAILKRYVEVFPSYQPSHLKGLAESYGYRHIVNLRRAATDGTLIELTHKEDDGTAPQLHLSLLPIAGAELIIGNGIEGLEGERAEVIVFRKAGRDVNFVSVMDPAADAGSRIAATPLDGLPDGVLGVELTRPDGLKDIVLSAETPQTLEFAGHAVAGQLVLLRTTPLATATQLVDTVE